MNRRGFLQIGAAATVAAVFTRGSRAAETAEAGPRFLLLDSRVVEKADGARLTVGTARKHPANPLFKEDQPWEVRFDNLYANVVFDEHERIYRCWYSPFIVDPAVTETPASQRATVRYKPRDREMGVCYATSRDGLHWEKPALGLVEFNGSKANNLVLRGPHGAGIFRDDAERDPARRFKLFCRAGDKLRTMAVAFSPDGLRWSELTPCPEIQVPGDTHNNALWSPDTGRYVGITRLKTDQRLVARTESADFIHWTKAVEVLRGDKLNQTYAMPVFRHAGVYLGLPMILRTAGDRVHCELAWSTDAVEWHRIDAGRPLIPNSDRPGDYDWGCVYAAATPVFLEREIRLYYGASNGPHTNWRDGFLALATLRPDGFAGYEPTDRNRVATVTTRAFKCGGARLRLSADAGGGTVRTTLLDDAGRKLAEAAPVTGNVTDQPLTWANGFNLAEHVGRPVRLAFELKAAKVYSFSFGR